MKTIPAWMPERIAAKIEFTDFCWIWKAGRMHRPDGTTAYGRVKHGYLWRAAHRMVWELANGRIPAGMCVLHRCDNPPCVNPDHLFLGTMQDNSDDMVQKGRHHDTEGTKNGNCKLSESDVINIRILDIPINKIASLYGIYKTTVSKIKRKVTWGHLP